MYQQFQPTHTSPEYLRRIINSCSQQLVNELQKAVKCYKSCNNTLVQHATDYIIELLEERITIEVCIIMPKWINCILVQIF